MAENSSPKRYMRTFFESLVERQRGSSGWIPYASKNKTSTDFQINRWANEHDLLLVNVTFSQESTAPRIVKEGASDVWERLTTRQYIVLYEPQNPKAFDYEHIVSDESRTPPMPLKDGAKAPTVEVTVVDRGVTRAVQAMAGIFGVPEGFKLWSEDETPAPPPLFSPDLDLKVYGKLFGNVGVRLEATSGPAAA